MDREIGVLLTEVGRAVEWPEPPSALSRRVVARITATPAPQRRRRLLPAVAVLAALVAAIVTVSPATRDAVADFLGIGGVKIESGPAPDLRPTRGSGLDLGEPVSLDEARVRVDFDIVVPTLPELGEPDEIYLDPAAPSAMVSLVYGERTGFDLAGDSDVSILITEFSASLVGTEDFFKKVTSEGAIVDRVEVNGTEGYWLIGEPHVFFYRDRAGNVVDESIRLVENVLLWEQDGVTLRIETTGSLAQARAIAASLRRL